MLLSLKERDEFLLISLEEGKAIHDAAQVHSRAGEEVMKNQGKLLQTWKDRHPQHSTSKDFK